MRTKLFILVVLSVFCLNQPSFSQNTWEKVSDTVKTSIVALTTNSNNEVSIGTSASGLLRSTDKGVTWITISDTGGLSSIRYLTISKKTNTIIILDAGYGPYRSTDNGGSWTLLADSLHIMNLTCNDDGIFYAGTPLWGDIRSTDDGITWVGWYSGLTQFSIYSFGFVDGSDVYCSSYGNAVYYSSDSGDNWNPIPIPFSYGYSDVSSLACYNNVVFAGAAIGLFRSSDNGTNWEKVSNFNIVTVKTDVDGRVYIVTKSSGVFKSLDGGKNFFEINSGLTEVDVTTMTISPDGYIYLGTSSGAVFRSVGVMTSISENKLTIPSGTKLKQNYPNPFNPTTNIEYSITRSGYVTIKVFNILGKLVSTLVQEEKQPGNYKVQFNGAAFPSGVYFYRMQTGNYTETKKFILLK